MKWRPWRQLGDVVPQVLKEWEGELRSPLRGVLEKWEQVVGRQVAEHAVPYALSRKVLSVFVDSSAWAAELSGFQAKEIVESLNEALGSTQIDALRCVTRRSTRRHRLAGGTDGEE